jgi:hypothetical protein
MRKMPAPQTTTASSVSRVIPSASTCRRSVLAPPKLRAPAMGGVGSISKTSRA